MSNLIHRAAAAAAAAPSSFAHLVEHGLYATGNTLGGTMQLIGGAFLAQAAWEHARKQESFGWPINSNNLPPIPSAFAWAAVPILGAAAATGVDPVVVATTCLAVGSCLRLLGRSSGGIRALRERLTVVEALNDATEKLRNFQGGLTHNIYANIIAINNQTTAINNQTTAMRDQLTAMRELANEERTE